MCLFKDTVFPRFSFKDKVVYKVLIKSISHYMPEYRYKTPCRGVRLNPGTTLKAAKKNWFPTIFVNEIQEEGVHAYTDIKTAIDSPFARPYVVFKCIIPKFTLYWSDKICNEIAARKLFITDEIIEIV